MRRRPWKRKSRGSLFTILCDVLINLLAYYMLMVGVQSDELRQTQVIASQVPGLKHSITGLKGELDDAKVELTKIAETGAKYQAIISDQETEIDKLGDQVRGLASENQALNGANENLSRELGEVKKHFRAGVPVTLVIICDVTASMQHVLDELLLVMSTVFEALPQQSSDFRVGILAFRKGVVAEFPITKIEPYYVDSGVSQQAALTFIESLSVGNAHTEHLSVFKHAVKAIGQAHPDKNAKRKLRILFLGDVGTSELDNKPGYSGGDRKAKDQILTGMQRWGERGNHAIVSLYAESESTRQDPSSSESREWFKELGSVSPQSAFHTNPNLLLRAVLKTARE